MYIKQAFNYLHDAWRYIIGTLVVFIAWQIIGALPFTLAIVFKLMGDGEDVFAYMEDPNALMSVLDSNLTLFLMLFAFVVGLIGLYAWVKYVHKQPWITLTTSRKKMDWGRFLFGFSIIGVFSVVTTLIDYNSNPEDYVMQFNLVPFLILAVIAILLIPLQTSFEEYWFRGYLMQGIGVNSKNKKFPLNFITTCAFLVLLFIGNVYTTWSPLLNVLLVIVGVLLLLLINFSGVFNGFFNSGTNGKLIETFGRNFTPLFITSLIFGGLHAFNPEVDKLGPIIMVFYIGTGFLLGIMTLMDEGMELALGFHAGNNLIAALLVTADWTAFQTHSILKDVSEPAAGADILIPVLVIYPIFLGLMAWRYKWSGWKEKLFGKVTPPEPDMISEIGTID